MRCAKGVEILGGSVSCGLDLGHVDSCSGFVPEPPEPASHSLVAALCAELLEDPKASTVDRLKEAAEALLEENITPGQVFDVLHLVVVAVKNEYRNY